MDVCVCVCVCARARARQHHRRELSIKDRQLAQMQAGAQRAAAQRDLMATELSRCHQVYILFIDDATRYIYCLLMMPPGIYIVY